MTDDQMSDDDALETFFKAARARPAPVPDAMMARILADAKALQPTPRRRNWLQAIGGMPALGGLVSAACVGVWIGIAPPAQLPDFGAVVLGFEDTSDTESYGLGWDIEEG